MTTPKTSAIVWFRNDLRTTDNPALAAAVSIGCPIVPLFIDEVAPSRTLGNSSTWWRYHSLLALNNTLETLGAKLIVKHGSPMHIIQDLITQFPISHIFWNRRYDTNGIKHDTAIKKHLLSQGIHCKSFNSSLLFEPHTIKNQQGTPFKVFTPFWKHCLSQSTAFYSTTPAPSSIDFLRESLEFSDNFEVLKPVSIKVQNLQSFWTPGEKSAQKALDFFIKNALLKYKSRRNYPGSLATSRLSPHLRWGEISTRQVWNTLKDIENRNPTNVDKFISELGWREFAYNVLFHNPEIDKKPLKENFPYIEYNTDTKLHEIWIKGLTGFPLVDAGMRELANTGYMHNRVRMITASFLIKDLLFPWQVGEQLFWDSLVDADPASNPFSWQWVAGCGYDAAPYFRVFNPMLQAKKFDPDGAYIRKWIPELAEVDSQYIHEPHRIIDKTIEYPPPIVDHNLARKRVTEIFKK